MGRKTDGFITKMNRFCCSLSNLHHSSHNEHSSGYLYELHNNISTQSYDDEKYILDNVMYNSKDN